MQNYINNALRTKSDAFHSDQVNPWELIALMDRAVKVSGALDAVKKGLFYGKEIPEDALEAGQDADRPYRGLKADFNHLDPDVIHSIIGSFTEAAELLELLAEAMMEGKAIPREKYMDETGDMLWYQAIGMNAYDTNFTELQYRNIQKLKERFPGKFEADLAINPNKNKEMEALLK
ncbi:hypothetical protein [Kiloniella sp.]|uniref:hypothetical protein n=1 Tax=Kiloniella sp. TaxID=1938587 RepID=UPI003B02CF95